jgi:hypothetical protein
VKLINIEQKKNPNQNKLIKIRKIKKLKKKIEENQREQGYQVET